MSRSASGVERRARPAAPDVLEQRGPRRRPASSCTQQPTTRPSHQAVVPALPLLSKRCGACGAEVEVALLPAHHRRVEHRQQRRPRLDRRLRRRGRRAAPSRCRRRRGRPRRPRRRPAPRARRRRWRPATRRRSASVPGPNVAQPAARPARRTPRRPRAAAGTLPQPAAPSASTAAGRSASGRALRPRTSSPSTAELGEHPGRDRDVGAVGLADGEVDPARELGQLARAAPGRGSSAPSAEPGQHRRPRRVEPGGAVVGEAGGLDLLGQPGAAAAPATRAEALPQAAGSRSRGKTKSVRRIASCLTSVRSS